MPQACTLAATTSCRHAHVVLSVLYAILPPDWGCKRIVAHPRLRLMLPVFELRPRFRMTRSIHDCGEGGPLRSADRSWLW